MKSFTRLFQGFCTALILCGPAAASEKFDEKTHFFTTYDFYIGGFSIAEITFGGSVGALGYTARSIVETRGILDLLINGEVDASAEGYRHTRGYLAPDRYKTAYSTRREDRKVNIAYNSEIATVNVSPPESKRPYDTKASDHPGTLDPVTAAVTMITPDDHADLCNRTIPVFDGKRRYDIILFPRDKRPAGETPPGPKWKKPTTWCFGVYERIAGFEGNLQKEQRYFPFDVWFEKGEDNIHRIVHIAGKTKLGFAIGTLRP